MISAAVGRLIKRDCSCKILMKLYLVSNLKLADFSYKTGNIHKNILFATKKLSKSRESSVF